jgi:transcription initiation factor TFIIH subunit 2
VCQRMAEETGGTYGIALNEAHLEELLLTHAPPPPASASSAGAELVSSLLDGETSRSSLAPQPSPPCSLSPLPPSLDRSNQRRPTSPPAPPKVRMGFPRRNAEDPSAAVHVGVAARLLAGGYTCPRCKARVCELPCECHVCRLTLISSPHLAR